MKDSRLNLLYTANLFFIHAMGLSAFFFSFNIACIPWMIFHYVWFGLASSLYYHRGLSHRSFEMVMPLQIFFLLGGLIGLSGDPIRWAALHRYHHQHSDMDEDLHSPRQGGWHAYMGWSSHLNQSWTQSMRFLADDLKKRWHLRWAGSDAATALVHFVYAGIFAGHFGLGATLWSIYLPLLLSYNFTWMLIAWLGHSPRAGRRSFASRDLSTNVGWLGLLSFGESFHNNHHDYPPRARAGLRWHEIDLSGYTLWIFEKLGLVHDVIWDRPARSKERAVDATP